MVTEDDGDHDEMLFWRGFGQGESVEERSRELAQTW